MVCFLLNGFLVWSKIYIMKVIFSLKALVLIFQINIKPSAIYHYSDVKSESIGPNFEIHIKPVPMLNYTFVAEYMSPELTTNNKKY